MTIVHFLDGFAGSNLDDDSGASLDHIGIWLIQRSSRATHDRRNGCFNDDGAGTPCAC